VLLFVPVRLLLGLVTGVATALLARALGVDGVDKLPVIVAGVAGFVIVCELLLPLLIVASDPERVLELLLPTFAPVARILKPFTLGISRSMAAKRPSQARLNQMKKRPKWRRPTSTPRNRKGLSRARNGSCCAASSISATRWCAK
jgi:CBS domain containing-hemolysin-like protein